MRGSYVCTLTQLDAEVGIVGFGGQGLNVSGQGGVPPWPDVYKSLFAGAPRALTPTPDVIGINEGENDSGDISAAYISTVRALLNALPAARIILMVPFSQRHVAEIESVINGLQDQRVSLVPTAGWFDPAHSSDGQDPYASAGNGVLGPKLLPYVSHALKSKK